MQTYNLSEICARSDIDLVELYYLLENLPHVGKIDEGPWIAGGLLRRLLTKQPLDKGDIDFFCHNSVQFDELKKNIEKMGHELIEENAHAITYKFTHSKEPTFLIGNEAETFYDKEYKIQLINIGFYDCVENLLDTFDFTLCQFALSKEGPTDFRLHTGDYTLWDVGRKRMVINEITFGLSTLRRMFKYQNQGYEICSGCLNYFLYSIANDSKLIRSDIKYVE